MKFYGHFAAAYGTIWLVLMLAAFIGQTHIDAGGFGLFGFPIIALLYALVRVNQRPAEGGQDREIQERLRNLERKLEPGEPDLG